MDTQKDPKEVELTSEKVVMFVLKLVLIVSGIVALFSLIWGNWYALRCALTIFFADIIGFAFGEYMADKFGKK